MNESSTTELNKSTSELETRRINRLITVEPPLLLFMFSATLVDTVFQNLVISRLCLSLGHNTSVCEDLSKFPAIEEQVQPDSALIFMTRTLIETILPAAILVFVGPWSDKHGRKPIMIYPLMGHVILYGSYFILSTKMAAEWSVYIFLIPSIAITFTGGYIAFVTGVYCYLSDVTLPEERAWRLGVVEAVLYTGLPLGIASSSYVFYWGGYLLVFGISCGAIALGLVYVISLPESVDLQTDQPSSGARGLCDLTLVSDLIKSCLQVRPGRRRTVIFLVLFMLTSTVFCIIGEMYVEFLYTRKLYHWTIKEYSIFSSVAQISTALGSLLGLYILSTKLRLPDASLAAISSLTKAISSLIRALATQPYILFIGSAVGVLSGMAAPLGRAVLSKSVSKEDVGKIFSVNAALDALAPVAAAPAFTLIYNSTLITLPGAFYFLTAALSVINTVFLGMNGSSTTELKKSTSELETRRINRLITVEPPLLLFMFSGTLVDTVFQNLVISRLCLSLGHNRSVCEHLSKFPAIEEQVQPDSALIFMSRTLIETILPAAILVFVGPWSDKHGRKPIMIYPLMGHVILYGSYFILSTEMAAQWSVYIFLIPSIAITFTGGYIAFVTGVYCYLSDVTLPEERAWRLGVVEAVLYTGLSLGTASSSYVFYWGGYLLVFGISCGAIALGFVYVISLPESVDLQTDKPSSGARGLCDLTLVSDLIKSCLQVRPGRRRTVIFLVLFMLTSTILCIIGEMYVEFLYTRKLYHWTIKEYSIFSSVAQISTALGSLLGLYILSTKLRLPDASLAAISSLTKAISSLIRALATQPYILFIGSAVGVLSGMAAPLGRAVLSKSVSKEDVGKIFSVNAALDALAPAAASPAFTLIYNSTLITLPGAFYFLTAALSVINTVFLGGVAMIHIKHPVQD